MREIARFSGVKCVGVNNNAHQLGRASVLTARAGLQSQCTFVQVRREARAQCWRCLLSTRLAERLHGHAFHERV